MGMPRIVQAKCPQCGAGLHIDPNARVVTCRFCGLSSLVHLPNAPDPRPPAAGKYGHIHIDPNALKAVGIMMLVTTAAPLVVGLVIALGVVGVIFVAVIASILKGPSSTSRPAAASPPPPAATAPATVPDGSSACAKAAACCRVVMTAGSGSSCEIYRAMSAADCARQLSGLRSAAKAQKRSCD